MNLGQNYLDLVLIELSCNQNRGHEFLNFCSSIHGSSSETVPRSGNLL